MPHIKKTVAMFLASALLGGGAWYLNTTSTLNGVVSSVFGSSFVCSEENLKNQAKEYRQKMIQQRKAIIYRDKLEATIMILRDAGKTTEMKQEQRALRTLTRGIGAFNRFIKAYSDCQKKLSDMPVMVAPNIDPVLDSAPAIGYDASRESGSVAGSTPSVTVQSAGTIPSVVIPNNSNIVVPVPVILAPQTTEPRTIEPLTTLPQ